MDSLSLLADIGGTNARFAMVDGPDGVPFDARTLSCDEYASLAEAAEAYLADVTATRPSRAVIAIATNVSSDRVSMTNHHWDFSIAETARRLDLESLQVVNDFTVLALSITRLEVHERQQVGVGEAAHDQPVAVLGPGTGLGVSGLIPAAGRMHPLQGEGGHVSYGPLNEREAAVINILRRSYEHVSVERLVSGPGISLLYRSLVEVDGIKSEVSSPAEITELALAGESALADEAVTMFCGILGTAAGNLALVLGARGGVYIGGGIVTRLGDYFLRSPFRHRFEQHGRFSRYLQEIPTWVIRAEYPALRGAAECLRTEYSYLGVTRSRGDA